MVVDKEGVVRVHSPGPHNPHAVIFQMPAREDDESPEEAISLTYYPVSCIYEMMQGEAIVTLTAGAIDQLSDLAHAMREDGDARWAKHMEHQYRGEG